MSNQPMLEKLTPEMERQIPKFVRMGFENGYRTGKMDREAARESVNTIYTKILGKDRGPSRILFRESPIQCHHIACLAILADAGEAVFPEDDDAEIRVTPAMFEDNAIPQFVWPYIDGQFTSGFFAHYDYLRDVCGCKIDCENYELYRKSLTHGPIWPMSGQDLCIVCDLPELAKHNQSGLHCEDGPAFRYPDHMFGDIEFYSLNGVVVPETVVMTPVADMDRNWLVSNFFQQQNVEVRREILRKMGADKFVDIVGAKTVDKMGSYSLLDIDLGSGIVATYLKMLNPSTGTWHVEGVVPTCRTCRSALLWSNNIPEDRVSEDGIDWYQQGDVLVIPDVFRNDPSVKLKPDPKILW